MPSGYPSAPPAIGASFGRLTVVGLRRREDRRLSADVHCVCGIDTSVLAINLIRGLTMSCGCFMRQRAREANVTHGLSRTREHIIWIGARARCLSPSNAAFPDYGGRGITMSSEWVNDFEAFLRDMGPCPIGATLDRKNNDGPYSLENCHWATKKAQANNRRSNHVVEAMGKRLTLAQWAEETGIAYDVIKQRLNKLGWIPERALTTPARPVRQVA